MTQKIKNVEIAQDSYLWHRFVQSPSEDSRNRLIVHYLPVAQLLARKIHKHLPVRVELEDLMQSAVLGLKDAIRSFNPRHGVRFETYCQPRIRGAMLDNLRSLLHPPRTLRTRAKRLEEAAQRLRMTFGRTPSNAEIAEAAHEPPPTSARSLAAPLPSVFTEADHNAPTVPDPATVPESVDSIADPRAVDPADSLQREELKRLFLSTLSRSERLIVLLYYYEDMSMREVGLTLGISEARVSQLHSRLLKRLKVLLVDRFERGAQRLASPVDL